MRKSLGLIAAAALVATVAAVAVSRAEPPATPPAAAPATETRPPASPDDLARGKALFTGTCAAYCHSTAQPEGASAAHGDAPYLFGCDWRHGGSPDEIFKTVSAGVPGTRMVPFGGAIPDEDIGRIVAYLKSASQCKPAP